MSLRRINEELAAGKLLPVVFPYRPAEIPVDDMLAVNQESANILFSAIVWLIDEKSWGIFEFDQTIMNALSGYSVRNGGMQKIECLLSRYPDGTLRINAGKPIAPAIDIIGVNDYNEMKGKAARLKDRYLKFDKYIFML